MTAIAHSSLAALHALAQREEGERDEALARLVDAREAADKAAAQAQQLRQYREEYAQRWTAQFRGGAGMDLLHCYQSFIARLDVAVMQQSSIAAHAAQRVEDHRLHTVACEQRLAAVKKLLGRRQAALAHREHRQEQRADDEAAQQMHAREESSRTAHNP